MGFIIGYMAVPFLVAFLIVHFGVKKSYEKKHNSPMNTGMEIAWIIGIGIVLLFLSFAGRLA